MFSYSDIYFKKKFKILFKSFKKCLVKIFKFFFKKIFLKFFLKVLKVLFYISTLFYSSLKFYGDAELCFHTSLGGRGEPRPPVRHLHRRPPMTRRRRKVAHATFEDRGPPSFPPISFVAASCLGPLLQTPPPTTMRWKIRRRTRTKAPPGAGLRRRFRRRMPLWKLSTTPVTKTPSIFPMFFVSLA